jgi:hypothetical protein
MAFSDIIYLDLRMMMMICIELDSSSQYASGGKIFIQLTTIKIHLLNVLLIAIV